MSSSQSYPEFANFEQFWIHFVSRHRNPLCRAMHFMGVSFFIALLFVSVSLQEPVLALWGALLAYCLAWYGHRKFELNRFQPYEHPLWSLRAEFRMYFKILLANMEPEIQKAAIVTAVRNAARTATAARTARQDLRDRSHLKLVK